jgi:hypothetical protein
VSNDICTSESKNWWTVMFFSLQRSYNTGAMIEIGLSQTRHLATGECFSHFSLLFSSL